MSIVPRLTAIYACPVNGMAYLVDTVTTCTGTILADGVQVPSLDASLEAYAVITSAHLVFAVHALLTMPIGDIIPGFTFSAVQVIPMG